MTQGRDQDLSALRTSAMAFAPPMRVAAVAIVVFALVRRSLTLPHAPGQFAPIGASVAVMLAVLLLTRRARWPAFIAAGFVGRVLAALSAGGRPELAVGLALCGLLEYLLAATLLIRALGRSPDLAQVKTHRTYLLIVGAAALAIGVLAGGVHDLLTGSRDFGLDVLTWATRDFAGMATLTPCILVLASPRRDWREFAGLRAWPLVLLLAVEVAVLLQNVLPLSFLVLAALLLVTWRLRIAGAAIGVLMTIAIAVPGALAGLGPFALIPGSPTQRLLLLQLFLTVCFYVTVPVASQVTRARRLKDELDLALKLSTDAQALYKLLADKVTDIVIRTDLEGCIQYISPACRTFGWEPEELMGKPPSFLTHPGDLDRLFQNTARVLTGDLGHPRDRRYRFRAKDGGYRWLEGNPAVLSDEHGAPCGLVNSFRDVTEQQATEEALAASEERYRLVADKVRDIVMKTDRQGRIEYVSPACRALGWEPEELLGRSPDHLLHPDDLPRAMANFERHMAGEVTHPRERRYRFRDADGIYRWYESSSVALVDDDGAPQGLIASFRDISEQQAAEEGLAASEERYRLITDNLLDVVLRSDLTGRIEYATPSVCALLGFEPEELVGKFPPELVHPDDRAAMTANLGDMAEGVVAPDRERVFRYMTKDGGYRWLQGKPGVVRNSDGIAVGLVTCLRDVTERRAGEQALAASEARYRIVSDNVRDVVVQTDLQGRIEFVSPACRILGYSPEELMGKPPSFLLHPDDLPRALANTARYLAGETNHVSERRYRFRGKDGTYRWFEGSPSVIRDPDGAPRGLLNSFRDIAEQQASEEALAASEARYRLLADNMNDLVACSGADGILTFVTGAAARILGYSPAEMVGIDAGAFVHPDDLAETRERFRRLTERPGEAVRIQYRARRKDGAYVWLEASPHAVFDERGEFVEFQDIVRDVTAHKTLEAGLEEARAVADAAAAQKAEFLADLSHELRGPLHSVEGLARLARKRPQVSEPVRAYLERIEEATRALLVLVDDVLEFSKLDAHQVVFRPRPVRVSDFARRKLAQFEPQAHAKNLELLYLDNIPAELVVSFDRDRLRQVVLNLLGNAVKFTRSGHITLETAYDAAAQRLTVSVTDTGPGIPADRMERLFKRFSQLGEAGPRSYVGAGLGLAISKRIVEGMGGEIGATSEFGRGSRFFFSIPAPLRDAAEVQEDETAAAPRLRVLVADADPDVATTVAESLGALNARVLTAADGDAVLELAAREPVDVILVELDLARRNAQAVLRRIRRRRGPNMVTPVLALTPPGDRTTLEEAMADGFEGLAAKPLSKAELVSAVAHALAVARDPPLRATSRRVPSAEPQAAAPSAEKTARRRPAKPVAAA
ncbi:MAG: PAS domain S-box protein [Phenylobacterium sp.]